MSDLSYLSGYPEFLQRKIEEMIKQKSLGDFLLNRYPTVHQYQTDKALYQYTLTIKNEFLRNHSMVNNVCYSSKIQVIKHALGLHHTINRVHGNKIKTKTKIEIASLFKTAPEPFLKMIVVHELAHLKEKQHDKAFYNLCCYMEPHYHQLEFDTRVYLTYLDIFGPLYQ